MFTTVKESSNYNSIHKDTLILVNWIEKKLNKNTS